VAHGSIPDGGALAALALADADRPVGGVDVAGFEVEGFREPQPGTDHDRDQSSRSDA
jgi:hypothetical protein